MSVMGTEQPPVSSTSIYHDLDIYPWESDRQFQSGLRAILGSATSPGHAERLELRAKCYYYARTFQTPVDFDGYLAHTAALIDHSETNGTSTSDSLNPTTTSSPQSAQASAPADLGTASARSSSPQPAQASTPADLGTASARSPNSDVTGGSTPTVQSSSSGMGGVENAPHPASFADIVAMIQEGKPIPGVKDIPDTVLEGQATTPVASKRRKPWEKEDPIVDNASDVPSPV
ncbi:hypothetical protein LTR50_007288 [Elasticomyces elasticus]|nr:hypothetical protein LTR50_007288 [Elasticomyces elasticus]